MQSRLFEDLLPQVKDEFRKVGVTVGRWTRSRAQVIEIGRSPNLLLVYVRTSEDPTQTWWGPSKKIIKSLKEAGSNWCIILLDQQYYNGYLLDSTYVEEMENEWSFSPRDNSYKVHDKAYDIDPSTLSHLNL